MVGAAIKTPTSSVPTPVPKPRPATPQREGSGRRTGRPALAIRVAFTVFIIWHFTGVFLAALSVNNNSELVLGIAQHRPMQWYLDALYMNQGHSFFAPYVGCGRLIHYQLLDQSGREIEHGDFPNRKEHWPRLLYHRYFMLADQSEVQADDKATRDLWQRNYLEAFGRQLLREHVQAQTVVVRRYNHWPIPYKYVADSLKSIRSQIKQLNEQKRSGEADELSSNLVKEAMIRGYSYFKDDFPREMQNRRIDDQGYELVGEASQTRNDLEPEARKQAANWQNMRADTASRPWGPPR
jgi:hypothetical protein